MRRLALTATLLMLTTAAWAQTGKVESQVLQETGVIE